MADEKTKELSFTDSWLQNTVEMAALGTILAGAGTFAVKGNLGTAVQGSKRALGAAGKGLENYIKRRAGLGTKFGYNVGKKTFNNLKRMPKSTDQNVMNDAFFRSYSKAVEHVEKPETVELIKNEAARRLNNIQSRNLINDAVNNTSYSQKEMKHEALKMYEKVRAEEIDSQQYGKKSPLAPPSQNKNKILKNKKDKMQQLREDAVGAGLTGLAFGAGISGFHALDRASSDLDNQKKLENIFHHAGSFLPRKENEDMQKKAGALEFYNSLKGLGRKTPEAMMSGVGFTGVSLGAANVLGRDPKSNGKDKDGDGSNTRVIIELGNPEEQAKEINTQPMGLAGLPKLAHENNMYKEASPFPKLKQFARDFRGYDQEVERLKKQNPADMAATLLKNENIDDMLKNQYGNLIDETSKGTFRKTLFDNQTESVKRTIQDQIDSLETKKAKARLTAAGAGLLGAGGLAGLAAARRPREENP